MSGQIVKYQGGLAYQDGDRVVPMQRQDLAEKFLQIMAGVEAGLVSQQQQQQAFQLMLQEERKAQSEALATVTRFADTAIATTQISNQLLAEENRELRGLVKDLATRDRASASGVEVVVEIQSGPSWQDVAPFFAAILFITGVTGILLMIGAHFERQMIYRPVPTIQQRSL